MRCDRYSHSAAALLLSRCAHAWHALPAHSMMCLAWWSCAAAVCCASCAGAQLLVMRRSRMLSSCSRVRLGYTLPGRTALLRATPAAVTAPVLQLDACDAAPLAAAAAAPAAACCCCWCSAC
jgi:hypothetical protein